MRSRRWLVLLLAAGCGRVGFDPTPLVGDGGGGDSGDGRRNDAADLCGIPGALFCDGFESPTLDVWTTTTGGAVRHLVPVRTGMAALGTPVDPAVLSSVRVHPFGDVTSGEIHARAWFFVPSGVPLTKLEILGVDDDTASSQILILIDQEEIRVYSELAVVTYTTGVAVTRDRWQCMELNVTISDTAGALSMQIDGVPVTAMSGFDTRPAAGYSAFVVGAKFAFPGQAITELSVDDVVVGTQPIGCN